jgi:hypothetical protein
MNRRGSKCKKARSHTHINTHTHTHTHNAHLLYHLQGIQREEVISAEQLFIWIPSLIAPSPSISIITVDKEKKGKTSNYVV